MKRVAAVMSLCVYAWPIVSAAQDFDFKGVVVGAKVATVDIEQRLGITCATSGGNQSCSGKTTMMSLPAEVHVDLLAGSVARMDVFYERFLFDAADKALKEKYGQPYGRKNTMVVWRNTRGDLVILQRDGLLSFTSITDQKKNEQEVRKMKKDF